MSAKIYNRTCIYKLHRIKKKKRKKETYQDDKLKNLSKTIEQVRVCNLKKGDSIIECNFRFYFYNYYALKFPSSIFKENVYYNLFLYKLYLKNHCYIKGLISREN